MAEVSAQHDPFNSAEYLTPFGDDSALPSPEHRLLALERAAQKLARIRSGDTLPPRSLRVRTHLMANGLALLTGLLMLALAVTAMGNNPSLLGAAVILVMGGAMIALRAALGLFGARSLQPHECVQHYFNALGSRQWSSAIGLVSETDQDGFVRKQPAATGFGSLPHGLPLDSADNLKTYWSYLTGRQLGQSAAISLSKFQTVYYVEGLCRVTCRCRITSNSALWLLWILIIPLAGALVSALGAWLTGRSVDVTLHKIVVKSGREWRLFNAEFEGPEEADVSWLTGALAARRT